MKKKFVENKVLFLLTLIIIICIVVIITALLMYFYSGNGISKYGSRLNGIEEYKLSEELDVKIKSLFEENYLNEVEVSVQGKIVYITIDLKNSLSKEDARSVGIKSLEAFSDEEKSFYDIQIIITTESVEEKADFYPMMGYLNANKTSIVWTNN